MTIYGRWQYLGPGFSPCLVHSKHFWSTGQVAHHHFLLNIIITILLLIIIVIIITTIEGPPHHHHHQSPSTIIECPCHHHLNLTCSRMLHMGCPVLQGTKWIANRFSNLMMTMMTTKMMTTMMTTKMMIILIIIFLSRWENWSGQMWTHPCHQDRDQFSLRWLLLRWLPPSLLPQRWLPYRWLPQRWLPPRWLPSQWLPAQWLPPSATRARDFATNFHFDRHDFLLILIWPLWHCGLIGKSENWKGGRCCGMCLLYSLNFSDLSTKGKGQSHLNSILQPFSFSSQSLKMETRWSVNVPLQPPWRPSLSRAARSNLSDSNMIGCWQNMFHILQAGRECWQKKVSIVSKQCKACKVTCAQPPPTPQFRSQIRQGVLIARQYRWDQPWTVFCCSLAIGSQLVNLGVSDGDAVAGLVRYNVDPSKVWVTKWS